MRILLPLQVWALNLRLLSIATVVLLKISMINAVIVL